MRRALLLLIGVSAIAAGAVEPDPQALRAPLAIASEPAGAAVFVDGRPRGVTPMQVPDLPAGEHRIRLVKDGYLDNSRVLSLKAGEPSNVRVALTPHPAAAPLRAVQVDTNPPPQRKSGGGGKKKALLIGAGVLAAGGVAYALLPKNEGPTPGTISVSPTGTGLQGATSFTFTASGASDPDGDSLTYAWSFGDGGSASGQSVSRTFTSAGSISVNLSVSDGKKSASAPAVNVEVRNLSGNWRGSVNVSGIVFNFTFNLSQSGSSVTGTYLDEDGPGTVSGNVSSPRSVSLTVNQPPFTPFTFVGTADASINTISGSALGVPFTMSR
jgi:hypothetical protein